MTNRLKVLFILFFLSVYAYGATRGIVPRADDEGRVGTNVKNWAAVYSQEYYIGAIRAIYYESNELQFNDATSGNQSLSDLLAGGSGLDNIVEDVTPQLGADLDLNTFALDFPTTPDIDDVLDEDAMGSDSATKLSTQQAIKAYVDGQDHTGSGSGESVTKQITQTSHTLVAENWVYLASDGLYKLADSDSSTTAEVAGIVYSDDGANLFTLLTDGYCDINTALPGSVGDVMFLSGTAGDETDSEPTLSKPVGIKISTTTMWVLIMRGLDITAILAGGTDDQTIDVFTFSTPNISLSLEDDGEATKTLDISGLDHDALFNFVAGEHIAEGTIDHGSIAGLTGDDHSAYENELTNSAGLLAALDDETGTGVAVFSISPVLVTPALGTPASGVLTNTTGLPVTGLANGTDGELITWSAAGVAEPVAVGTATQVLTSNGVGVPPTFQAPAGGGTDDQTIDVFTFSTPNISLSLEGDGEATKTLDVSSLVLPNISQVTDITATASEINTPLDGALVLLNEFQQLETIGATTISANQWATLGGIAETLTSAELDLLDGITVLSGSNTGDDVTNYESELDDSAGLLAALSDETGTGLAVFNTSPTLITPLLGTPTSGVMTNMTGLPVTGLANGTDGELITWSAAGVAATVPVGTVGQVLTSGGVGVAPTMQTPAAGGGGDNITKAIVQTSHTLIAGDWVYFDGADYVLADADAIGTSDVAGVVESDDGANDFTLLTHGFFDQGSALAGSAGDQLFLSGTAGTETATSPTLSAPLGVQISANTMWVNILRPIVGGVADSVKNAPGYLHGLNFVYSSTTAVTVKTGYGECNGLYWEITTDTAHAMTSLVSGADWHWAYIDYSTLSASDFTPDIIDSATPPTWDDAKQGYYNGDDRAVAFFQSIAASATIVAFSAVRTGTQFRYVNGRNSILGSNMAPTGSWQSPTTALTALGPDFMDEALVILSSTDVGGDGAQCYVATSEMAAIGASLVKESQVWESWTSASYEGAAVQINTWLVLGASMELKVAAESNDDTNLDGWVQGYALNF
jgi:hypothetical protein